MEDVSPFQDGKQASIQIPWWLSGKESACNTRDAGDVGLTLSPEDPLEEGKATHSNILAGKTPWTEEPGVLQPMGLQRAGHD